MNRAQKMSLTVVITFLLGFLLGIILVVMRLFDLDVPKIAFLFPVFIAGSGGIISITCLKKDRGAITFDERDKLIDRKANAIGIVGAFIFLAGAGWLLSVITKMGSIKAPLVILLVYLACFVWILVSSVAALIQYGWRSIGEKS